LRMQLKVDPLIDSHRCNAIHFSRSRTETQALQRMQSAFRLGHLRCEFLILLLPECQQREAGEGKSSSNQGLTRMRRWHGLTPLAGMQPFGMNPRYRKSCKNAQATKVMTMKINDLRRRWGREKKPVTVGFVLQAGSQLVDIAGRNARCDAIVEKGNATAADSVTTHLNQQSL